MQLFNPLLFSPHLDVLCSPSNLGCPHYSGSQGSVFESCNIKKYDLLKKYYQTTVNTFFQNSYRKQNWQIKELLPNYYALFFRSLYHTILTLIKGYHRTKHFQSSIQPMMTFSNNYYRIIPIFFQSPYQTTLTLHKS